jgi:hypothetical protein
MWRRAALPLVAACAACGPVDQPASLRTVAAVEIPIETAADRNDLVAILRRGAAADGGLHVDDVSDRWRSFEAEANMAAPEQRGTIFVAVWRGANDDEPEADADDDRHPGRTWLTFAQGSDPARSARFRQEVLADVARRWPDRRLLPVLPSGGLALSEDLRLTGTGYKIARSAAASYQLPASSPLVAPE